jgi:hypothetical protein
MSVLHWHIYSRTAIPGRSKPAPACTLCVRLCDKFIPLLPRDFSSIGNRPVDFQWLYLTHKSEPDSLRLSFSRSLFDIYSLNVAVWSNCSLICIQTSSLASPALFSEGINWWLPLPAATQTRVALDRLIYRCSIRFGSPDAEPPHENPRHGTIWESYQMGPVPLLLLNWSFVRACRKQKTATIRCHSASKKTARICWRVY